MQEDVAGQRQSPQADQSSPPSLLPSFCPTGPSGGTHTRPSRDPPNTHITFSSNTRKFVLLHIHTTTAHPKSRPAMTCFYGVCILLLLVVVFNMATAQMPSFADTRFDLPPDLPAEDLPPIAANQDAKPATEAAAPQTQPPPPPPPSPETQPPATPPPTQPAPPPQTQPPPPPPAQFVPNPPLPIAAAQPSSTTANPKTPLPQLPNLVELPRFRVGHDGNVQTLTIPPSLVEAPTTNQSSSTVLTIVATTARHPPPPLAKVPPTIGQSLRSPAAFDTRNCPRNANAMAKHFKRKFPKNLLRNQKETVLAELLAIRLKECARKQREDYWARLDAILSKGAAEGGDAERASEREECRAGLIQEQIACMDVQSFSCQFIQPTFLFRLVPTRIIVQEARLAEDGAEKCRRFSANNEKSRK